MAIRSIQRRNTVIGYANPDEAPIYVKIADNILRFIPAGSGTSEVQIIDASSTQTITNKTISVADGSASAPTVTFTSDAANNESGLFKPTTAYIGFSAGATAIAAINNDGGGLQGIRLSSASQLGWSSSTGITSASDIALSRVSAGVLGVGTGAQASVAGTLQLATLQSTAAAGSLGYSTGAGGVVTQQTSRTTGVTLNRPSGQITMFSAAGSATAATFTVTNSVVSATDTIILNQASGTNLYQLFVTAVTGGSFNITFFTTGGVATDAPVINFTVIKGASS